MTESHEQVIKRMRAHYADLGIKKFRYLQVEYDVKPARKKAQADSKGAGK